MINFDALPQDKPMGSLLDPGFYKGKIVKAEMKNKKTPAPGDKPYLALTYDLMDYAGKACGKFWDNIFESDKDIPRYKLKRFILALELPLTGSFELKDLTKIVVNKELIIDVGVDEKAERPKNQVDVFKNEMFYPVREWAALMGVEAAESSAENNDDLPFDVDEDISEAVDSDVINAADAEDVADNESSEFSEDGDDY